jgi:hypothetical protein
MEEGNMEMTDGRNENAPAASRAVLGKGDAE